MLCHIGMVNGAQKPQNGELGRGSSCLPPFPPAPLFPLQISQQGKWKSENENELGPFSRNSWYRAVAAGIVPPKPFLPTPQTVPHIPFCMEGSQQQTPEGLR